MLPGFRILLALVVLSFAMLIFGFSALALLRTAHQNLASQPAWQPSWRTPLEIANAQRDERQSPSGAQTLALLRLDPPATPPPAVVESSPANTEPAAPVSAPPAVQAPVGEASNGAPERDPSADVKPAQPSVDASAPSPKTDDRLVAIESIEPVAASGAKPVEQEKTTPRVDAPTPAASHANDAPAATEAPTPPSAEAVTLAPSAAEPNTTAASAKTETPAIDTASAEASAPKTETPIKLAALPDSTTSSSEAWAKTAQQTAKKPDAAELRAKRRARARLRARRLAMARARAALLAQTQQATTSSFSGFPTVASSAPATINAANATLFGAPRGAP